MLQRLPRGGRQRPSWVAFAAHEKFDRRHAAKLAKMAPEDVMNPRICKLVGAGLLLALGCALSNCYYYAPSPAYYGGYAPYYAATPYGPSVGAGVPPPPNQPPTPR